MFKWNLFLICVFSSNVQTMALPVVNLNVSGATTLTVFPDHKDGSIFYVAPNSLMVARDSASVPVFSYLEIASLFKTQAAIQTTIAPYYSNASELEEVRARIQGVNPQAKFTALPFMESKTVFTETLSALMVKNECNHTAGLVGDAQACSFLVNSKGRKIFRNMLREGVAITVQLEYSVSGVKEDSTGQFVDAVNTYRISGAIGSTELKKYPQLFRDSKGEVIDFDQEDF